MIKLIRDIAKLGFEIAGQIRVPVNVYAEPTSTRDIEADSSAVVFAKQRENYKAIVFDVKQSDAKGGSEAAAGNKKGKKLLLLIADFPGWVLDERCEFLIEGQRWKTSLCEKDPATATAGFTLYS